jgi:hypothetical protein
MAAAVALESRRRPSRRCQPHMRAHAIHLATHIQLNPRTFTTGGWSSWWSSYLAAPLLPRRVRRVLSQQAGGASAVPPQARRKRAPCSTRCRRRSPARSGRSSSSSDRHRPPHPPAASARGARRRGWRTSRRQLHRLRGRAAIAARHGRVPRVACLPPLTPGWTSLCLAPRSCAGFAGARPLLCAAPRLASSRPRCVEVRVAVSGLGWRLTLLRARRNPRVCHERACSRFCAAKRAR